MSKLGIVIITLSFLLPIGAIAYSESPSGGKLSATVTPTNPQPGQQVSIRLFSYQADVDTSTISWSIEGQTMKQGIGEKTFTFTAPTVCTTRIIGATVTTAGGEQLSKMFVFESNTVHLMWEGQTHVPPFYRGHRAASPGASVAVMAVPEIRGADSNRLGSSQLLFRWYKDDKNLPLSSGTGKDSMRFTMDPYGQAATIKVDIYSLDGALKASRSLTIESSRPRLVFYRHSPLLGTAYQIALRAVRVGSGEEVTIKTEPYFMKDANFASYQWKQGTKDASPTDADRSFMTFRAPTGESGETTVSLTAANSDSFLQVAKASLPIIFGQSNSSLFGL